MNVEEARRAVFRRDEDIAWMRLVQHHHRERGEVLRGEQRQRTEDRKARERELREANQDFDEQQGRLQQLSDREAEEERQRAAADSKRRQAYEKRKEERKLAKVRAADAEVEGRRQDAMDVNAARIARRQEDERREKAEIELRFRQSLTPAPAVSPHATPPPVRARTTTSVYSPRPIRAASEMEQAAAEEKLRERDFLEVRRLQNLLVVREETQRGIEHDDVRRMERYDGEQRKAAEVDWRRYEEHRQKQQRVEAQRRDREKRVTGRVLVPLTHSAGAMGLVSVRSAAGSEANKSDLQLDDEARQRREQSKAERFAQQQSSQKLVSQKNAKNYKHMRGVRKDTVALRDAQYKAELGAALRMHEQELADARAMVLEEKAAQQHSAEHVVQMREPRQRDVTIMALQSRLEAAEHAGNVEARNLELYRERMDESDLLVRNRKTALELLHLQEHKHRQQNATLGEVFNDRRKAAQRETDRAAKRKIVAAEKLHKQRTQNLRQFRIVQAVNKKGEQSRTDAFYQQEGDRRAPKAGAPQQPAASDPVYLPPHPEMESYELGTAQRVSSLDDDLSGVDAQMALLEKQRTHM
jgi:hypothetical protein